MTSLCPHFTPFGIRASIAVFNPLGSFFGGVPGKINGKIRFCTYFTAKGDKIVNTYLVKIVASAVGLGLNRYISKEWCPLINI
jgi:hypothetical protein